MPDIEEREEWMIHIAHDIGALGRKNTFKIIDSVYKGEDRGKIRQYYTEVCKILDSSKDFDKPLA